MAEITIANRRIGSGHPVFIIAEISANHRGSLAVARETIEAAAAAGADAVKFQTYTADSLTLDSSQEYFRIQEGTVWDGRTLHDVYSEGELPRAWHPELLSYAKELGLVAFSSPFDVEAVAFLDSLGVPAFKIASFEIFDFELIAAAARTGKPVILSTGVAEESDIASAVGVCRSEGNSSVAVLKCTSAYPAPPEELNLRNIPDMAERFNCVVGFSDHTMGLAAPLGAVALGAQIIERHITLDRDQAGLDSSFSTNPQEFAHLVQSVRELEVSLGSIDYSLGPSASRNRRFGRSLFIVRDVREGEIASSENVRSIRPADGLHPRELAQVLGRRFTSSVSAGTPLQHEHLI